LVGEAVGREGEGGELGAELGGDVAEGGHGGGVVRGVVVCWWL
jgi:hypothetical protein